MSRHLQLQFLLSPWTLLAVCILFTASEARYVMYYTGQQHKTIPSLDLTSHITHVCIAFMASSYFNNDPSPPPSPNLSKYEEGNSDRNYSYPLHTSVSELRTKFSPNTKILISIGGWGDTAGFEVAASNEEGMEVWARNVKRVVEDSGADGVDVDWEYPGGNGEDYLTHPNPTKLWQVAAYPTLLSILRTHLPSPTYLITAAVPALPRDMIAFTPSTLPLISTHLDFLNVMTYDMVNRRDRVTDHHTGIKHSKTAVWTYVSNAPGGTLPLSKINLGFAFYTRWYKTSPLPDDKAECREKKGLGCKLPIMEDPETGRDLGLCGAFSYHDIPPAHLAKSWKKAQENPVYDEYKNSIEGGGGNYYWDEEEDLFWSWDTPRAILEKFPKLVVGDGEGGGKLGGVFAWALGEDAPGFEHLEALNEGVKTWGVNDGDDSSGGTSEESNRIEGLFEQHRAEL